LNYTRAGPHFKANWRVNQPSLAFNVYRGKTTLTRLPWPSSVSKDSVAA